MNDMNKNKISKFLCLLLRHQPEKANLDMDERGWVSVEQLISGVNSLGEFTITKQLLEEIVDEDEKGRYRFNDNHDKIKCCQGHSIPWVIPELDYRKPPEYLYHGTNTEALKGIMKSGSINKMKRHAVHMQADISKAWKSAERWNKTPVVLKISANVMYKEGYQFGVTENDVWCIENIPIKYISEQIYSK